LLFEERQKLHTTGDLLGPDGIPYNRGVWEMDDGQYDDDPLIFSGSGGASAFRKEVWQELGGFDEEFWMYLEDVDFGFRAQLLGWGAVFAPAARVYHHLSATGGGVMASYYVGRNTIWTIAKNMPTTLLLRNRHLSCWPNWKLPLMRWRISGARRPVRGCVANWLVSWAYRGNCVNANLFKPVVKWMTKALPCTLIESIAQLGRATRAAGPSQLLVCLTTLFSLPSTKLAGNYASTTRKTRLLLSWR